MSTSLLWQLLAITHPYEIARGFCDGNRDDTDKFLEWAFGKNFGTLPTWEYPQKWNRLHGNKLKITDDDDILKSLEKMKEIYDQENQKNDEQ
jgi:hypothetical protein